MGKIFCRVTFLKMTPMSLRDATWIFCLLQEEYRHVYHNKIDRIASLSIILLSLRYKHNIVTEWYFQVIQRTMERDYSCNKIIEQLSIKLSYKTIINLMISPRRDYPIIISGNIARGNNLVKCRMPCVCIIQSIAISYREKKRARDSFITGDPRGVTINTANGRKAE